MTERCADVGEKKQKHVNHEEEQGLEKVLFGDGRE